MTLLVGTFDKDFLNGLWHWLTFFWAEVTDSEADRFSATRYQFVELVVVIVVTELDTCLFGDVTSCSEYFTY